MKCFSSITLLLLFIISNPIKAQDGKDIGVGDLLRIEASQNYQYAHVQFPRPNFIIKRGGVANYKKLIGTLVEVTEVKKNKNDETIIILKRKDNKKFFGSFPVIRANYNNAIASEELSKIKSPN